MNQSEVEKLTSELRRKINSLPDDIENSERLLNESRAKLEKLLGMQASVERVNKLKSDFIPRMRDDLKKIDADLAANQEKIKKAQSDVKEPKARMNLITEIIGDISVLEEAFRDIHQTRIDLEPLLRNAPTGDGGNDMDNLQKKRKELNDRIKVLEAEIIQKEKKCAEDEREINGYKVFQWNFHKKT